MTPHLSDDAAVVRPPEVLGTSTAIRRQVANYYDRMQVFYSRLWSRTGVHYGFWERNTFRLSQAIRNMDRDVAAALGLPGRSLVLDAGCGVGGTSQYLAERHSLNVVGITLSGVQSRIARRRASSSSAAARLAFLEADYVRAPFCDETFDGIFAIESICYAEDKRAVLAEAFRLLRNGGRLVVMDGFLAKSPLSPTERSDYRDFVRGVAATDLATVGGFERDLREIGFEDIRCTDKRRQVLPSAFLIEAMTVIGTKLVLPLFRRGVLPALWWHHGLAGMSQRRLIQGGVMAYCVFTATKRRRRLKPS